MTNPDAQRQSENPAGADSHTWVGDGDDVICRYCAVSPWMTAVTEVCPGSGQLTSKSGGGARPAGEDAASAADEPDQRAARERRARRFLEWLGEDDGPD